MLKVLNEFMHRESTAGVLLFFCTLIALVWSNSWLAPYYHELWHHTFSIGFADHVITKTLHHWINDGLMAMFFFVVGLEIKREFIAGELSSLRNASLPLAAALGGMLVPALIYLLQNSSGPQSDGWGIPMATDIAFALGLLALLGKRVPLALKVFLTALAIADDLGAVLIIAFFYTSEISVLNLGLGVLAMALLMLANYVGIRSTLFYGVVGIGGVWLAFLLSGVHATIAGILAALTIPARTRIDENTFTTKLRKYVDEFYAISPNDVSLLEPEQMHVLNKISSLTKAADTPLQRLEHRLHPLVAFVVVPIFALANAGITLDLNAWGQVFSSVSLGVALGLFVGKSVGVVGACLIMVRLGWASLPTGVTWSQIVGVAFLAGIGFTMSLFVTNLAFTSQEFILQAKLGVLMASIVAGTIGYIILHKTLPAK